MKSCKCRGDAKKIRKLTGFSCLLVLLMFCTGCGKPWEQKTRLTKTYASCEVALGKDSAYFQLKDKNCSEVKHLYKHSAILVGNQLWAEDKNCDYLWIYPMWHPIETAEKQLNYGKFKVDVTLYLIDGAYEGDDVKKVNDMMASYRVKVENHYILGTTDMHSLHEDPQSIDKVDKQHKEALYQEIVKELDAQTNLK